MRRAGVVSLLLTPPGAGPEMVGLIVAERKHSRRPWTPAETSAVEWIAANVGRGLHHPRLYVAEKRRRQPYSRNRVRGLITSRWSGLLDHLSVVRLRDLTPECGTGCGGLAHIGTVLAHSQSEASRPVRVW